MALRRTAGDRAEPFARAASGRSPFTVSLLSGSPPEVAAALARRGYRRIYLDGGRTIQAFLAAGLVSELTVTTIPVLLGRGRPLFGPLPGDVKLRVTASKAWAFGFVQTRYEPVDGRDAGA